MDIATPINARRKRVRRAVLGSLGVVLIALVGLGLSRLEPAAPTVDVKTIWPDTVKRGSMLRAVQGLGTLVPENIRWIPATTQGRVERIILRPGTPVLPGSVILELTNPQLDQELQDAELAVRAADATLASLRAQVNNDLLQQRATAAEIEAALNKAQMQEQMNRALAKDRLVSALVLRQSEMDAAQLSIRSDIAQQQLASKAEAVTAQLAVQQSAVEQARAVLALKRRQRDELRVRAGIDGVLQLVPVDVGQQVAPGTNLARVADSSRLKADVKIPETLAKDIQIGQPAQIDTRNGVIQGRVSRIDPSVQNGTRSVDVTLHGALPKGAVPDLSIEGTIEIERLENVLFVGRPASARDGSVVGLFRITADSRAAERVQVKLGRSSVNTVEVVSGLQAGDRVILSDTSEWNAFNRIRLQ